MQASSNSLQPWVNKFHAVILGTATTQEALAAQDKTMTWRDRTT